MAVEATTAAVTARSTQRRLLRVFPVALAICFVTCFFAFRAGLDRSPAPSVAGEYRTAAPGCLGGGGAKASLVQSGQFLTLSAPGVADAKLRLRHHRATGTAHCVGGGTAALSADLRAGPPLHLQGTVGTSPLSLVRTGGPAAETKAATKPRSPEDTFGRLMLAIAAVILAARVVRVVVGRLGEPPVMGEVLAGILLGPTLLGSVAPSVEHYLFPADIVPLLSAAASIGLAFYMFLVGLELDPKALKGRVLQAVLTSNTSVVGALTLGIVVAVPLYTLLAPSVRFVPFALFIGVSMAITAFPVLARILVDRRMIRQPTGALALATAAVDDVTAWILLALASAIALTGTGLGALKVLGYLVLFGLGMGLVVRPLLNRVSTAYDEAGHVPAGWIATIFVGVLLSAYLAVLIGINAIFGAFVMGLIMPRRADLSHDVARRLDDFVVTVLLPLFFVITGLRTKIGALDRPELWLLTLLLIGVAVLGKGVLVTILGRLGGFRLREAAAFGSLMNTRGLTELIVLNIALDLHVISQALFTMLVIMALVTTFMTGPLLKLLDPKGTLSDRPGEAFLATTAPEGAAATHSILVAPQDLHHLDPLLALAEPLARSQPPRELILAGLIVPSRIATGLASNDRELRLATEELERRRATLRDHEVEARVVSFTTPDAGEDLVRLAADERIDLLLMDGRRPLLGGGVPRGDVGAVLERAECDVAVLVERKGTPLIDSEHPVVVPFGGAEHDWAALELGAWIATAYDAPLTLLGAAFNLADGTRDASRLLASASLVVQQLTGIVAQPALANPGADVIRKAEGAGLLVVGLSERWRTEGLGPLRSELVKSPPAPTLLVRRGTRAGALAPRENMTRFAWSSARDPMRRT
jgi:Kef-type K+ transport system membrane component KefB